MMNEFINIYTFMISLASKYPGGYSQFKADGGMLSFVPLKKICLVYLREVPDSFRQFINELNNKTEEFKVVIVDTFNCAGQNEKAVTIEVQKAVIMMEKKLDVQLLIGYNDLLFIVTIIKGTVTSDEMTDIAAVFMTYVPGIVRIAVVNMVPIQPYTLYHTIETVPSIKTDIIAHEKCDHEQIITSDVITNLKIELGHNEDVLDFLKRI